MESGFGTLAGGQLEDYELIAQLERVRGNLKETESEMKKLLDLEQELNHIEFQLMDEYRIYENWHHLRKLQVLQKRLIQEARLLLVFLPPSFLFFFCPCC